VPQEVPRRTTKAEVPKVGERQGGRLGAARPLAQEENAEQGVEEEIHEVAQAGLQDVPRADRLNVEQPVAGDKRRGQPTGRQAAPGAEGLQVLGSSPGDGGQPGQEDRRPEDAVGQDLQGRHAFQRLEIERKRAPHEVGAERGAHAGAGRGLVHALPSPAGSERERRPDAPECLSSRPAPCEFSGVRPRMSIPIRGRLPVARSCNARAGAAIHPW
jgi:hypothetical protein